MHIHGSMYTTRKLQHFYISRMQLCTSSPAPCRMLHLVLFPIAKKVPKNKHMFPLWFLFKGQEGLDGERGKPGQQGLPVRDAALL